MIFEDDHSHAQDLGELGLGEDDELEDSAEQIGETFSHIDENQYPCIISLDPRNRSQTLDLKRKKDELQKMLTLVEAPNHAGYIHSHSYTHN
jgi:hypothetical protein